jgi:hypothetical protein
LAPGTQTHLRSKVAQQPFFGVQAVENLSKILSRIFECSVCINGVLSVRENAKKKIQQSSSLILDDGT